MMARVMSFLTRRPGFGWVASLFAGGSATAVHAAGSTVETVGALPPVPSHLIAWLTVFGAVVSISVGVITGLAQLANLRARKREEREAKAAKTKEQASAQEGKARE